MYRNQYLVTNKTKLEFQGIRPYHFNDLDIYSHPSLNISSSKYLSTEIVLLGYIINPQKPSDSNNEIVHHLAVECTTQELLFKQIQLLSGRYLLIYKNGPSFIVVGDACSLRQIYYGFINDNIVLTSCPKMFLDYFNYDLQISSLKQEFINTKQYKKNESAWYGDKCIDDRLRKLLPNHYLDINDKKVKRIPLYPIENLSSDCDVIDYASYILRGTFASLVNRYSLIQPLTAGWDTRILLAASRDVKDKIRFYVFSHSSAPNEPDIWVPKKLSEKLALRFQVITQGQIENDFLIEYKKEHILPRILPKTADIQYHYYNNSGTNIINVNGNGGEIARCFYGYTSRTINPRILLHFSNYPADNEFIKKELEHWYYDAYEYSREVNIPLLDLFYWEQRMGNWGALYPFEQDIAIEEISPFNNKSLLISLLSIHPKKRRSPHYHFFIKLILSLWPDVLAVPINPGQSTVNKIIKGRSMMRYYAMKLIQTARFLAAIKLRGFNKKG